MFNINDNVKINNTNLTGKITRIKKKSNSTLYTVNVNNTNITLEEEKLSYYNTNKNNFDNTKRNNNSSNNNNNITITYTSSNKNFVNEIMIRHQTVEVALENLERFISQAILNKEKRIKIIHGRHGGILRNAVHKYLAQSPYIEKYNLGDYYEGSIGVTIAYLK